MRNTEKPTPRKQRVTRSSVTNFLYCGDQYLFLHRSADKKTDPNRLNGIGGKLESGENYLDAAIRETKEETGYIVDPKNVQLSGIVQLHGGYPEDWIMCFFRIQVDDLIVPVGMNTNDGTLMWIHKDQVLKSEHELVDDLHYCFEKIVEGKSIFFMTAQLNDEQKITSHSISFL